MHAAQQVWPERWEFIKENKKVRKKELDQEKRTRPRKKRTRPRKRPSKKELDQESDPDHTFLFS